MKANRDWGEMEDEPGNKKKESSSALFPFTPCGQERGRAIVGVDLAKGAINICLYTTPPSHTYSLVLVQIEISSSWGLSQAIKKNQ